MVHRKSTSIPTSPTRAPLLPLRRYRYPDGVKINPDPMSEWEPLPVLSRELKKQARKKKEKCLRDNEMRGSIYDEKRDNDGTYIRLDKIFGNLFDKANRLEHESWICGNTENGLFERRKMEKNSRDRNDKIFGILDLAHKI